MNVGAFHYDVMASLAREMQIASFLEVGVSGGGSFLATVAAGRETLRRVVACDTWGATHGGQNRGSHAHIATALDELGYAGHRVYLDGPSAELVPDYARAHPDLIDLVHVDGDHTEAGALSDLRAVWPLVGRCLVVHDVFMPPVWAALSQFAREHVAELAGFDVSADGTGTAVLRRAA